MPATGHGEGTPVGDINTVRLPSGVEYNLTDGVHMPSEATTVAEMVANATGAGDTGIAVFGLSASLTNTICGTSASSICVTKYSSTDSRVDFTIQIPSVTGIGRPEDGNSFIEGSIDLSNSNSITLNYENTLNFSTHIGATLIQSVDVFVDVVSHRATGESGDSANRKNLNRLTCFVMAGNLARALTGSVNLPLAGFCFAYYGGSSSARSIEYAFFAPAYSSAGSAYPSVYYGSVNPTTKKVNCRSNNWYDRPAYFTNQTVNVGTATTIMTITSDKIFANSIVTSITFDHPEYITSDVTWTSAAGSMTFTGTCTTATTANVIIQLAQGA